MDTQTLATPATSEVSSSSLPVSTPATSSAEWPTIRVGGVPEHFNLPWHIGIERRLFDKHRVNVQWVEVKEGTGAMISQLKEGRVDVIVALTEGLVADIAKGSDLRLISTYVESPLTWAISTGKNSAYHSVEDLRRQPIGVSRMGSGSHIMSYVLAMQRGWDLDELKFEIKGDFKSLRDSLNDGSTAMFMWETFMTKPYHLSGEIRRVGDITTPWPCFMVASTTKILGVHKRAIEGVLAGVREACNIFSSIESKTIPDEVARRYHLKPNDALSWYENVRITCSPRISLAALDRTLTTLRAVRLLPADNKARASKLLDESFAQLQVDIKAMKLYQRPELIMQLYNNLRSIGKSSGGISFRDLLPFDQHHYEGIEAVDECAKLCRIGPGSSVINVGSGLAGPARYLAGTYGSEVLAIELQEDLHGAAAELTGRCEEAVKDLVTHLGGDVLKLGRHLQTGRYDAIVSWLTVLHFDRPSRASLFKQSRSLLRAGGCFYVDDFVAVGTLTDTENQILRDDVYCSYLPTVDQYQSELLNAGFTIAVCESLTSSWCTWTAQRRDRWIASRAEQMKLHGQAIYDSLLTFFTLIADLFSGGHVGGIRIVARVPLPSSSPIASSSSSSATFDVDAIDSCF